jgi:hypothetical protein
VRLPCPPVAPPHLPPHVSSRPLQASLPPVLRRPPAWVVCAVLAGLWLLLAPPTPDLAAQVYRSNLFGRIGFSVWDLSWYGGHHMPGYSLLFPPLGALLGPRIVGALAAIVSVILFERLIAPYFSVRATRIAAVWFAIIVVCDLLIGRLTYGLGVTVGLCAVLSLSRGHPWLAAVLGIACATASPVTGVFTALAGGAVFLSGADRRALALAVTSLGTLLVMAALFPEGGAQPFRWFQIIVPLLVCGAVLALARPGDRTLRIGTILYVVGCCLTMAVTSPLGDNVLRLGALVGGSLMAALWVDRVPGQTRLPKRALLAVGVVFLAWQLAGPIREVVKSSGDPSTSQAYYAPVLGFLKAHADAATRIEVPFTRGHWEAAYLAPHVPLARGWETQLDKKIGSLFYDHRDATFTAAKYHAWLRYNAVSFVVVPDVPPDPSSVREVAVIDSRPPWLRLVWTGPHWRAYAVRDTLPLVSGPATVVALRPNSFTLRVSAPGEVEVRVHKTPYYDVARGQACILPSRGDWTRLRVARAGLVRVDARFTLDDVGGGDSLCPTPVR